MTKQELDKTEASERSEEKTGDLLSTAEEDQVNGGRCAEWEQGAGVMRDNLKTRKKVTLDIWCMKKFNIKNEPHA